MESKILVCTAVMLMIITPEVVAAVKHDIGVCYGRLGSDLPPPSDVVSLFEKYGIGKMRIYDPDHDVLKALKGSDIDLVLGVLNADIPGIASSVKGARAWLDPWLPYFADVKIAYITIGNEVIPGPFAAAVPKAISNLRAVLDSIQLRDVAVSTAVATSVLTITYPPSDSVFTNETTAVMRSLLEVLQSTGSPLFVNLHPYFAYKYDPVNIHLDYVMFTSKEPVVTDGEFSYKNLFDAMLDGMYWAMEKEGFGKVRVVVSETGWPSYGNGNITTPKLAETYNKNFVHKILSRVPSPKRPGVSLVGYVFAMFNENLKQEGEERNWGLFYPDKKPVYNVFDVQSSLD